MKVESDTCVSLNRELFGQGVYLIHKVGELVLRVHGMVLKCTCSEVANEELETS